MKKELAKKILELNKLFQEVNLIVAKHYDEVHEVFEAEYPFAESFDEVAENVSDWAIAVESKMQNKKD